MIDATILRLVISQAFSIFFVLLLVPLKEPKKRNTIFVLIVAFIVIIINALIIEFIGLPFYIRFYPLTLILPYVILGFFFSSLRMSKFVFAVLSVQVIGNVTIINGLFASYLLFGENTPLIDTTARIVTYILFLPIILKIIRPIYIKMSYSLNKGWIILNSALILSYALSYFILFVPNDIFKRPEYFAHGYIGIILSLLIYAIIFFLFIEIESKNDIEHDKQILAKKVRTLSVNSAKLNTIVYNDVLTGVKNRYALFTEMNQYITKREDFLIMFIDLDNLKAVNDTYNHGKGDNYLRNFAQTIQKSLIGIGEVYRFAGDEFVCLVKNGKLNSFDANKLKNNIKKEIAIDIPFLGFSYGIANYPSDGDNPDDLINFADQEMYLQKKSKKDL